MLYDVNGNVVANNAAFRVDGQSLSAAYSIEGEQVFPESPATFKVMTYNVQKFTGINSQGNMLSAIINQHEPDIIGMQELGSYSVSNLPAVGQTMLTNYPIRQLSNHVNKVMMATKAYTLSNVVIADFTNQDPQDLSRYNETRAYMKADIVIGGKTVTWINTHLCYLTQSVKWQQMAELFAIAEQCERVIITGDFNSMQMDASANDYINMYKPFVDAGYHLANCSPDSGFQNTFSSSTSPTSLSDLTTAPDTIIVSGNIAIGNVVFDTTKFAYLNGSAFDHIPVVAELTVN